MGLLKTVATPFRNFFAFFTEEIPHEKKEQKKEPNDGLHELTAYGRHLYWENRRKETLLKEQQNKNPQ